MPLVINAAKMAAPLANETSRSVEKPPINTATLPKSFIVMILSVLMTVATEVVLSSAALNLIH